MGIEAAQEAENADIDLEAIVANESAEQENQEQEETPQLSDSEQKAFDQGWRPLEEFNGPEDNWKSAKEYIRDGEWMAKLKEKDQRLDKMEREFHDRVDNINKFNEAQRKQDIANLKAKQRDAVEMSDTEAFDSTQKQIDALENQPVETKQAQPAADPDIAAWETKNPWINDLTDRRTAVAQGVFDNYGKQNPTATVAQALAHVDKEMSEIFPSNPKENPRRSQANTTENNNRRPARQGKELSMNDLTQDERNQWNQFGSMMFTEKEFLKTIKDTRAK